MLRVYYEIFNGKPTIREVARKSGIAPETLSRIVNGKQAPGYGEGQSAERIAHAVGWTGDVRELFEEVGCDMSVNTCCSHEPNMTVIDLDYPMYGTVIVRCGGVEFGMESARKVLALAAELGRELKHG